jgi:hypothetical protein
LTAPGVSFGDYPVFLALRATSSVKTLPLLS